MDIQSDKNKTPFSKRFSPLAQKQNFPLVKKLSSMWVSMMRKAEMPIATPLQPTAWAELEKREKREVGNLFLKG